MRLGPGLWPGPRHARKIATVIAGHHSFQIDIDGQTVTVVPRTTSREIHRYKAAAHSGGSGTWGLPDRSSLDVPVIALRPVADSDLGPLFDQMRDPESVRMAAFTPDDPDNRTAFDAHMATVRSSPDITLRAVTCDNHLVGSIAAFVLDGRTEVTYWIDRAAWGHGIASRALELLLDLIPVRPLHARVASDNAASLRVLQKLGFKVTGTENSFAPGRNSNIEETILRKD